MTKQERYNAKRRAATQRRIEARPVPHCNNPKCGKPLPKVPWGRKWCGTGCRVDVRWKERSRRAAMSKLARFPAAKYVYEAVKDAKPGECPWGCEQQLAPRERTCCRRKACRSAYNSAYAMGRREMIRAAAPPRQQETRPCGCGCLETVVVGVHNRKYVNRTHERRAWKARKRRLSIRDIAAKVRGCA